MMADDDEDMQRGWAVDGVSLTVIREKLPKNIRYSLIINEIREFPPKN